MASFLTVVSLIQRDTTTVSAELVSSFSADLLTFLSSNNPTALQSGIVALDKTAFGKKVRECLKGCNIPSNGFAGGAMSGIKWKDQPVEVTGPIMETHSRIVGQFETLLTGAGLFEKKVQSEEVKAANTAKREEKAATALSNAVAAEVASRGLVDPSTIAVLGVNAQLDCVLALLAANLLDTAQLAALGQSLVDAIGSIPLAKSFATHLKVMAVTPVAPVAPVAPVDTLATV